MTALSRIVIGAHLFVAVEGAAFTQPAPGVVSRTAKPGAADAKWLDFGEGDHDIEPTSKDVEFMAPAPGARMLKDIITLSKGLKIKSKCMEVRNLHVQMLLGTLALPDAGAGGQYNPLESTHRVKAWLKLQQYTVDNALFNVMDVYCSGKIASSVKFGDQPVDIEIDWDVLYSTLNTGTLS